MLREKKTARNKVGELKKWGKFSAQRVPVT